ncbi:glycosyl transferase [Syncephalastrum racemosum]|uniref:Alpha-1,3-glucosyltransferase n=1 Tax=Syncephalastrum racemosum TaxID=13706 RepID=A0A1X2HV32_SYNRA|nr:glycosyl transferase [Syncephalastrum racemosum]
MSVNQGVTAWLTGYANESSLSWALGPVIALCALAVRWMVALAPYSGMATPPMMGDYEAQRHWMEITQHLPTKEWYTYDLDWWGLDYPPLTAYHSWLCGKIGSWIEPAWFALDTSRAFESGESKFFMRNTVIISEALIYLPAVYYFARITYRSDTTKKYLAVLLMALHPALIIIDHGHFQYNNVMLGLSLWTINCLLTDRFIVGSIFFCLALGFKQMALYYSPAVFAFLLSQCFHRQNGLLLFMYLGTTVTLTMAMLLLPWLTSPTDLLQVAHRVFPVARGLYEDKVANVWCALNVVIKLRTFLSLTATVRLSLVTTLVATIPINIHLGCNPTWARFRYALLNTSLAFFLLSFQVHEKSILLPLLPASLMILEETDAVVLFTNTAMFSMYPLLRREDLVIPYVAVTVLWNWMVGLYQGTETLQKQRIRVTHGIFMFWHIVEALVQPPERFPDLYAVMNAVLSCGIFGILFAYFVYRQMYYTVPASAYGMVEGKFKSQ